MDSQFPAQEPARIECERLIRPEQHQKPIGSMNGLKRLKDQLALKLDSQRLQKVTPSKLYAKSMLTFDLHKGPLADDEVPGDSELFVNFVTNRRRSSGRGSLKEMINKRIAHQTGARALALRKAEAKENSEKLNQERVDSQIKVDESSASVHDTRERKRHKVTKQRAVPESARLSSESLEVPLGQEESTEARNENPILSQTQVLHREDPALSQTQPYVPTDAHVSATPTQVFRGDALPRTASPSLPFLATPQVDGDAESESSPEIPRRRLETVFEEVPRGRNRFIEDEADESDDCDGSDDEEGEDGFLSDLIASSSEDEMGTQDEARMARLHAQWMREQEDSFDPFSIKGRKALPEDVGFEDIKARRARYAKAAKQLEDKPKLPKKPNRLPKKTKPVVDVVKPVEIKGRVQPRPKKNPNRRSSVSSIGSDLDLHVGRNMLNRARRSSLGVKGTFSFISVPDKLEKTMAEAARKDEASAKAAAGSSKLMGKKRFAFGD
jgi:hypothetical protein